MKRALLADTDLCIGCFACEVACKQEHNLPVGVRWMEIVQEGPTEVNGRLVMAFIPTHCMHCGKPPCKEACPTNAIYQRSDGVVLIDQEKCIGCGACIEACPFGAPQYMEEKNIVQKCDLCVERTDQELLPACVQHCPTGALIFGTPNLLADKIRNRQTEKMVWRFEYGDF